VLLLRWNQTESESTEEEKMSNIKEVREPPWGVWRLFTSELTETKLLS